MRTRGPWLAAPWFLLLEPEMQIAERYLAVENRHRGFVKTIHAADEMYQFTKDSLVVDDAYRRFLYFKRGHEILLSLENALARAGKKLSSFENVLDFGCGYGRLTRYLVQEISASRVSSCDIQRQAVEFAASAFGVRGFVSSTEPDGVRFDRHYDLILVVSLFSHLPRERFTQWLAKLYEALAPNGVLLFSTHGEHLCRGHPLDPSSFTFFPGAEIEQLDPTEYGVTFVSRSAVGKIGSSCGIKHLYSVERDLCVHQDLYLAARDEVPGLENWQRTPIIRGFIDTVRVEANRQLHIDGWAADNSQGAPLAEVTLQIDGLDLGRASVGQARKDIPSAFYRTDWLESGWCLDTILPQIPAGKHVLAGFSRSPAGERACFDMRQLGQLKSDATPVP